MQKQTLPQQVLTSEFYRYHHQTKHTMESLYSGGHHLDWANQPDPFRTYDGAPKIDLDTDIEVADQNFFETLISFHENLRRTPDEIKTYLEKNERPAGDSGQRSSTPSIMAPTARFISNLLFYSMSISAWKQIVGTDHRWALRVNASSGNLHPTDTHVLVRDIDGIDAGAYHYLVNEHKLERRIQSDLVTSLCSLLATDCPPPRLMLCMTSVFWREAWKYRDRAFRYCQHDMGHALATVSLSAASLGWTTRIMSLFPDEKLAAILGLAESDERPLALFALAPLNETQFPGHQAPGSIFGSIFGGRGTNGGNKTDSDSQGTRSGDKGTATDTWTTKELTSHKPMGTPNILSKSTVPYPSIDKVYASTCYSIEDWKNARSNITQLPTDDEPKALPSNIVACADAIETEHVLSKANSDCIHESVHKTIRLRRSAVDMDGQTGMSKAHLEYILGCATSGFAADFQSCDRFGGNDQVQKNNEPNGADSRFTGEKLSTGGLHLIKLFLYVNRVDGLARGLYYYDRGNQLLVPLLLKDVRQLARSVSCFQDIASDGAFAVSMIADFNLGYSLFKERCYRLAHYEAGFIGQIFYLTACALGHDSTGIGCFIDDAINEFLALPEGEEVIYNFTFGKAVIDERLTTLPSYSFADSACSQ